MRTAADSILGRRTEQSEVPSANHGPRRSARSTAWFALAVAGLACGCRFAGVHGAVPDSLVRSRQLAQEGLNELSQNNCAAACDLLAEAVRTCPEDAQAHSSFGQALARLGDSDRARSELEEAIRLAEDNAEIRVHLGELHLAAGRLEEAHATAQSAIEIDPALASAWDLRGKIHRAAGQARRALADLQQAIQLDPERIEALYEVAELYAELDEPGQALAVLCVLADSYAPGETPQRVLYLEGLTLAKLGRFRDAATSLQAAQKAGGTDPDLLYHLARCQLLAGQAAAARKTLFLAVADFPEHGPSLALLEQMAARR